MNSNEIAPLKSASVKLGDDLMAYVLLTYHAEKGDRSKSFYRYDGEVCKISDMQKRIDEMGSDAKKLEEFRFATIPNFKLTGFTKDAGSDNNGAAAKWFAMRIKKLLEPADYVAKCWKGGKDDYPKAFKTDEDKDLDISDVEALKAAAGHRFTFIVQPKTTKRANNAAASMNKVVD